MKKLIVALALFLALPARAEQPADGGGEVRVPLAAYTALINQLAVVPRPAPAAYAIGRSEVNVTVSERGAETAATVQITVQIETFEDDWTLVPVLPAGAALKSATVDGRPVQLVQTTDGLAWTTDQAGTVTLQLAYGVDARRTEASLLLPIALPVAAATDFTLTFPGTDMDLAVVPSADLQSVEQDGVTRITASLPATSHALVSWRAADSRPYVMSRAHYSGELRDDALVWLGRYQVELFGRERITLPLMPTSVTLNDLRIDGQPATVLEQEGRFATVLQGRGSHQIEVEFQVPVIQADGPPRAILSIPRIPVSHFELLLPGKKEVKVTPSATVVTREDETATTASVFIPMSESVVFTWTEAVPEALRAQVRANASLYHVAHAEEGVLHGRASVVYEITHGATSQLTLEIPDDTQVNRITAPAGGVSDWAVSAAQAPGRKRIDVFLEREVTGEYLLEIAYERLLDGEPAFEVPLLSALEVHRQRGMVALLSGQELALKPLTEDGLSRVGENQLPAFVRNQITMTVAHTYKYSDPTPSLRVETVAPERKRGIFDAQVDTLISLGEVAMKGSATVAIDVKSGAIVALDLRLPANTNILGVSGPSLRSHQVREEDGQQVIGLEFTREMAGQFRIEVNYERILDGTAPETLVPTVAVSDAEVEHGRIAVEALTAVEVRATTNEQLSNLDLNELPQQLVLKTTNPILLAFRYVHATPPFKLALTITRHREIEVQVAAIEQADYSSLFTRDGLAVTTARLIVRNSRRQFLRLALPPESQVWSVFVDGKPEKPAYASDAAKGEGTAILVRMINSAEGFPVEIVYATPVAALGTLGQLSSRLPRPDMVVTHTRWDVFLPVGPHYQSPDSTMDVIVGGAWANPRLAGALARAGDAYQAQIGQPLKIAVPAQGIRLAFEKLYANQSPDDAEFSVHYVSAGVNQAGLALSALGALLLWVAIVALGGQRLRLSRRRIVAVLGLGALFLLVPIGFLGTSPLPASALALIIAVVIALWWAVSRWRSWRVARVV